MGLLAAALGLAANSHAEPFAYVGGGFGIAVIDTATKKIVQQGNVFYPGVGPVGVAIAPDGSTGYFSETHRNRVRAYTYIGPANPGPHEGRIPVGTNHPDFGFVGSHPAGLAMTPDGKFVYVANSFEDSVSVINTATNTMVVTAIPVGDLPSGVDVTLDGDLVYVTNTFGGSVSAIATATNKVVATIPVGAMPYGIASTPDAKFVYVANMGESTVSVISREKNQVVDTILVGVAPFGVTVAPDGRRVYVSNNGGNSVSVIDAKDRRVIATIPLTGTEATLPISKPVGMSITPDGESLYVPTNGSGYPITYVAVISTKTLQVTDYIPINGPNYNVVASLGKFICGHPKERGPNKGGIETKPGRDKTPDPCEFDPNVKWPS